MHAEGSGAMLTGWERGPEREVRRRCEQEHGLTEDGEGVEAWGMLDGRCDAFRLGEGRISRKETKVVTGTVLLRLGRE